MKSKLDTSVWFNELITGKRFIYWCKEIAEHKFVIFVSLILVAIALFIDYVSGYFVTYVVPAVEVADLILSNIGPIDLSFIFVYLFSIVMALYFIYPLFFKVKMIHKAISIYSLLILVRSLFICMTHLKTPTDAIPVTYPLIFNTFGFQNDMFFSGHTAIPFLGFLIYEGPIKYFFLISTILIAASALIMHRHYSIDVFAAFFIAYGVYKLGTYLFGKIDSYQNSKRGVTTKQSIL